MSNLNEIFAGIVSFDENEDNTIVKYRHEGILEEIGENITHSHYEKLCEILNLYLKVFTLDVPLLSFGKEHVRNKLIYSLKKGSYEKYLKFRESLKMFELEHLDKVLKEREIVEETFKPKVDEAELELEILYEELRKRRVVNVNYNV